MKAIFAHRNDAHKLNGVPQTIVEIVGERITVRLSTTGKKADFQVRDVVSFDGELTFYADENVIAASNDATPAPIPYPLPAPLFDAPMLVEEIQVDAEATPTKPARK